MCKYVIVITVIARQDVDPATLHYTQPINQYCLIIARQFTGDKNLAGVQY